MKFRILMVLVVLGFTAPWVVVATQMATNAATAENHTTTVADKSVIAKNAGLNK